MSHPRLDIAGAPPPAHGFRVRAVRFDGGLEGLREDWQALTATLPEPAFYHRWAWHAAFCRHLAEMPITYHCAYHYGRLVVVLPLSPAAGGRASLRARTLAMPENPQINLGDVVMAPDAGPALERLLQGVCMPDGSRWDLVTFYRIPARSRLLAATSSLPHLTASSDGGGSTWFDCRKPASLERLSSKLLRNLERLRRNAQERVGSLSMETFRRPGEMEAAFGRFLGIEASGWKGESGTAVALLPRARAFFLDVLRAYACAGEARVDVLRIGGCPAAAHLALRSGGAWYLLKTGYDPRLGSFSPGQLLLRLFLEQAAADDAVREVNLITAPEWAERWHAEREPVHTVRIYGRTPGGFLLSVGRRVKEAAKKVRDVGSIAEAAL